jgi:hypothetical protein
MIGRPLQPYTAAPHLNGVVQGVPPLHIHGVVSALGQLIDIAGLLQVEFPWQGSFEVPFQKPAIPASRRMKDI